MRRQLEWVPQGRSQTEVVCRSPYIRWNFGLVALALLGVFAIALALMLPNSITPVAATDESFFPISAGLPVVLAGRRASTPLLWLHLDG
jgi:hypothetical protein